MKKLIIILYVFSSYLFAHDEPGMPSAVIQSSQAVAYVNIVKRVNGDLQTLGKGSGFFFRDTSTFVTNAHVLSSLFLSAKSDGHDFLDLLTIIKDGRHYAVKSVKHISMLYDLAVLEVEGYAGPVLETVALELPAELYAVGFFENRLRTVKANSFYSQNVDPMYALAPHFVSTKKLSGLSGSPVLSARGQVVGIVSQNRPWYLGVIKMVFLQQLLDNHDSQETISIGDLENVIQQQMHSMYDAAEQGDLLSQRVMGNLFLRPFDYFEVHSPAVEVSKTVLNDEGFQKNHFIYWYRQVALQGHPATQFDLGLMYWEGEDEAIYNSEEEAIKWFQRSAAQGYPYAEFILSYFFQYGFVVNRSEEESFEWMKRAALQGHPRAQFKLGIFHLYGYGTSESKEQGLQWLETAAGRGNPLARFALGLIHFFGKGVEQDMHKAFHYFYQAALSDHQPSQFVLGSMYIDGLGTEPDNQQGNYWLNQSMRDGRFGWFADSLMNSDESYVAIDKSKVYDMLFIQLIINPEMSMGMKQLVQLAEDLEGPDIF